MKAVPLRCHMFQTWKNGSAEVSPSRWAGLAVGLGRGEEPTGDRRFGRPSHSIPDEELVNFNLLEWRGGAVHQSGRGSMT